MPERAPRSAVAGCRYAGGPTGSACAAVPPGAPMLINLHCPPAQRLRPTPVGADAKGRELFRRYRRRGCGPRVCPARRRSGGHGPQGGAGAPPFCVTACGVTTPPEWCRKGVRHRRPSPRVQNWRCVPKPAFYGVKRIISAHGDALRADSLRLARGQGDELTLSRTHPHAHGLTFRRGPSARRPRDTSLRARGNPRNAVTQKRPPRPTVGRDERLSFACKSAGNHPEQAGR